MIYRKIFPTAPGARVMVVDENGDVHGEIFARTAALADVAAGFMIAVLQRNDAEREHVRMHTIGDEVVEIGTGTGSGEGE
jgi:hypothetical protein